MNKEKLYEAMPVEVIKESDVQNRMLGEKEVITHGREFVSQLSINRFLTKPLVEFTLEERLNLFTVLQHESFAIKENLLHLAEFKVKELETILQREFHLENPYTFDALYIERLLDGEDLDIKEIDMYGESLDFIDILEQFAFQQSGVSLLDSASVMLMLVVKKALLRIHLAEENIKRLSEGKRAIYDLTILK